VTGVRASEFTGSYGARAQNADVLIADNRVNVTMLQPLPFHQGLTVVVGWDKGFVKEPGTSERSINSWQATGRSFSPFPSPHHVLAVYTRGRDPRVGPISVQYAPPDGMTPAEAGTLVDDNVAMRDITATIVDLAVRGFLLIEEKEKSQLMGLVSNKEYIFHLKKGPSEWTGLKPHELILIAGIFANGLTGDVELSSLQISFTQNFPASRTASSTRSCSAGTSRTGRTTCAALTWALES